MKENLKELWRFRELLWAMVERELRIRYKNSFLGFFWSLLNPLVTVAVMTLVFKFLLQNDTSNFSAYILAAYLPFLFFNMSLMDASQSVLAALPVVKKVYFPREILPLSSVISNFIHFFLALLVFLAWLGLVWFATGMQDSPFTWRLGFLPVLFLIQFCLVTGLSFIISALNVFFEDTKYILSVMLYLLFFITPIMYFSETIVYALSGKPYANLVYTVYHLNPVAMLSTAYRKTMVKPGLIEVTEQRTVLLDGHSVQAGISTKVHSLPFDWTMFGITVAMSILFLVAGYAIFNKYKWRFVERP